MIRWWLNAGYSDEGLQGAQQHFADAGECRALLPLVDRQAAGRRQVVRENLLHARGQRAREELQADLVVASHRQAVDVRRADRRPTPVHRHRLRVHHRVTIQPDFHALAQQLAVVGARHPVRQDVVGILGNQHLDAHAAAGGGDQRAEDLAVGNEIRRRDEHAVRRALDRVDVHAADRVQQVVRQVELRGHVRAPRARPLIGQLRTGCGAEVIPEVDETVFQLPHGLARDAHVGVAPLVRERIANVVAAHEADLAVDHEDLAVILARAANVQGEEARAQRRETTHVQIRHRGELVEARILVEDAEAVPHTEHLDAALGRVDQRRLKTLAPAVRAPNEGLEINVMRRPFDGLQHVRVQGGSLRVRARHRVADLRVGGRQGGETVHATGDTGGAHAVDRVHGHDCGRLGGEQSDSRFFDDRPRLSGELASLRKGHTGRMPHMSRISTDEVARVAGLAHIALTDEEITRFAGELDAIADAVSKVSEVATPEVPATSHPIPLTNVWREDVVGQTVDRDEVLAQAPAAQDGMFLVPQILGED